MATITCQDCGATRERAPQNTKYCKSCRLLRNMDYWRHRRKRCKGCQAEFAPLGRADTHCSACDPGLLYQPIDDCAMGATTQRHSGRTLIPGIPVCAQCLRDPDMRPALVAALERGQRNRKAASC